jgi:hypothetical protein
MPFGKKPAGHGKLVDFDAVYENMIRPAVVAAGLEPLRADEEKTGGVIHKAMFERLILCEFAVADLTTANANVFYELGLRHAVRPWTTLLLFADGWGQLPFDVGMLRAMPYKLGSDGTPAEAAADSIALSEKLKGAREAKTDSPVFQMVEGFPDIQRLKTDVFRDRVRYAEGIKAQLALARKAGEVSVVAVETGLGELGHADSSVVVDLFLSYRAVGAWQRMIDMVPHMSPPLAASVMIQEQLGLALNRTGRGEEAERVVLHLIHERGPSSETLGILGRVYKDRWEAAAEAGMVVLARGLLEKAIDAYLSGFEADWRDAYPGVNAVTLMELKEPRDDRQASLLPVVAYAVERRMAHGRPDYWDYATRLELAILGKNKCAAEAALMDALANVREPWEAESTARNLRLIYRAWTAAGDDTTWLASIQSHLKVFPK